MRYILCVLLLCPPFWGQAPPTGHATSNVPCSVANAGNDNKISINCGIGREQGQKILSLLNKILMDRIDPDAVMAKLDEILHAVNPNLRTKAYFCNGGWRTQGPGANAALQVTMDPSEDPSLKQMIDLANARPRDNNELLKICGSEIESNPEWLTPRLFCALAYAGVGNSTKAKEMLDVYDSRKGPAYDENSLCQQLSNAAHSALQ